MLQKTKKYKNSENSTKNNWRKRKKYVKILSKVKLILTKKEFIIIKFVISQNYLLHFIEWILRKGLYF